MAGPCSRRPVSSTGQLRHMGIRASSWFVPALSALTPAPGRCRSTRMSRHTRSAISWMNVPGHLFRKEVRRIPLRINIFHPVLPEHEIGDL